jgi:hypothetical protein
MAKPQLTFDLVSWKIERQENPIKTLYNRGKRGKKTVILQLILSIRLLERSEKDLVLPKRNSGSEAKRTAYSRGAIRAVEHHS